MALKFTVTIPLEDIAKRFGLPHGVTKCTVEGGSLVMSSGTTTAAKPRSTHERRMHLWKKGYTVAEMAHALEDTKSAIRQWHKRYALRINRAIAPPNSTPASSNGAH